MINMNSRKTLRSSDYEGCEECRVSLLIYPNEYIHPDEVSNILQLEPTKKNIINTVVTNSLGRTRKITVAGWFLSSEKYVQSKDIRDHLDWLLRKILPSKNGLIQLQNIQGIQMRIECDWWAISTRGPTLWPEQMKIMADLNLECTFNISFYGSKD